MRGVAMFNSSDTEPETRQQSCCVCHDVSPITNTNYTLISPKHQWRMELRANEQGEREPYWYCPTCWQRLREQRNSAKRIPINR